MQEAKQAAPICMTVLALIKFQANHCHEVVLQASFSLAHAYSFTALFFIKWLQARI